MKEWPSGSHLLMRTTTTNDIVLYVLGYKYNKDNVLIFIFTENAGLTIDGRAYLAKFRDASNTQQTRKISRPQVVSRYFDDSNIIDVHNQSRQGDLKLEEYWQTQDPWFRLFTTVLGMTVTDAWKLFLWSLKTKVPIKDFASWLAHDCIHNDYSDADSESVAPFAPSVLQARGLGSVAGQNGFEIVAGQNGFEIIAGRNSSGSSISALSESHCIPVTIEHVRAMHRFDFTDRTTKEKNKTRRVRRKCLVAGCTETRIRTECFNKECKLVGKFYCDEHMCVHHDEVFKNMKAAGKGNE